jgi:hypothetical protein
MDRSISGADGTRLLKWTSYKLNLFQLVVETETIGGLNGDGFPDVAVGRMGSIRVMSGKDGDRNVATTWFLAFQWRRRSDIFRISLASGGN